ncbi:MAG: CDP-alcohol phosphatidyltransferase family protein [Thermoplasmatota archaeon]|nr:CDP-alcohol phosphatidyltransferase family protein [Halobacteriales archaeon]
MVLDKHRSVLDVWLDPLARVCRGIHPDVFTWLSLVAAVVGGVLFWKSSPTPDGLNLFLLAFVCVGVNSIFDMLDGKVAKISGKASPRGDFLDHAVDRASDVAFLAGIAFSPWAHEGLGLFAIAGTLLASYMGTQAQAVGLKRHYGGVLGRADRMVLLLVVPVAEYFVRALEWPQPWTHPVGAWAFRSLLDLMLAYFAVMGMATAAQRFVSILRGLAPPRP